MTEEKETKSKKRSIFKTIFSIMGRLVEAGLLVLLFVVAVSTFLPGRGFTGQYRLFTVMSGSMEPAISTGSLIVSKSIDSASQDQVIVYEDPRSDIPNSFVAHRVTEVNETDDGVEYTTKGDANDLADRYTITNNDLIGDVQFSIPKLGYLSAYAKTPQGLVLLAILPALLVIVMELRHIVKTIDSHYKKKHGDNEEHKHDVTTSSLIIFLGIGLSAVASSTGIFAMFNGQVLGVNNTFASDSWFLEAPENLGWNVNSQSATPNEGNPDSLDLPCIDGGAQVTTENSVAHNWSPVSGDDIRYQREVTFPNGSIGFYYATANFTPFSTFGGGGGINGLWRTRVRAFEDNNLNGVFDAGDFESEWSNYCDLILDNTPPPAPTVTSPANDSVVNTSGLVIDWTDVVDVNNLHDPVYYIYQSATNPGFSPLAYTSGHLSASEIPAPGTPQNEYWIRVMACDTLDNCSPWSATHHITVDNSAPSSSITVSSSPTRDIEERIVNGGFEAGLDSWTTIGDVEVLSAAENGVSPFDSKMARIGNTNPDPLANGNPVDVNILSQDFSNVGGLRSVGFSYNFATYEDGAGFDEPGFMVFAGDQLVHQVWASDVETDSDSSTLETTGWRYLSVDLTYVDDPTLTIAFYGGNTGDLNRQSFVYVDNVTTNVATVNSSASFEITGSDNVGVATAHYSYEVGGIPVTGSGPSPFSFSISDQPDGDVIEYWSVDEAGNEQSPHNTFLVKYDDTAPSSVTDLSVTDEGDGDFALDFTAVSDVNPFGVNQAGEYDFRYSIDPITPAISDVDWDALPKPTIYNIDGLPAGGPREPLLSGSPESYLVHVNEGADTYYFAVRVKDRAGNRSALTVGSIDSASTDSTTAVLPGAVVINEVMWTGSSASSEDEWIELRNLTDSAIDLEGWVIENGGDGGSPDITLPAGSVIPAKGFYVISNFAASSGSSALLNEPDLVEADLDLDDAGEQLTLKDGSATIIDQTPLADSGWDEGLNDTVTPAYRSMERNTDPGAGVPLDGTDPASWHTCDSDACADARILHWDSVGSNFGTPGDENLSTDDDSLVTTVTLSEIDEENVEFEVTDVSIFTHYEFELTYDHDEGEGVISEAVLGGKDFGPNDVSVTSDPIYLGTCSENGEVCTPHTNITNVEVTVTLTGPSVPDRTVDDTL